MKPIYLRILLTLSTPMFFASQIAQTQSDVDFVKAARKSWDNLNYFETKDLYKNAIEANESNFDANLELGILEVRVYQNYERGLYYFQKALNNMPADTVYEVYQFLGQSFHQLSQYDSAIDNYQIFTKGIKNNEDLKKEIELKIKQCEFAKSYDYIHRDGKFKNMGSSINTESSEYCAVLPMKDSFLLFTKRTSENISGSTSVIAWEEIYFSNNKNNKFHPADYSEELTDFENLSKDEDLHYAVVSKSFTGDTLVMYKGNGLWYSTYESSFWSEPIKLPKEINKGRNQRHGCFSADGQTFYFSSKGLFGKTGYDLFVSEIDSTGNWGEARLMDSTINTLADEDSPFITKDGSRLYFASTGHLGYGEYDIFFCDRTEEGWSNPKNAGRTINSAGDDIFYSEFNDEDRTSLISSSRVGGKGQMDIYFFYDYGIPKFDSCTVQLQGLILDSLAENKSHVFCSGSDTLNTKQSDVYSPWNSILNGEKIMNVFFKQNDSIMIADSLTLVYDSAGTYSIEMEVLTRDSLDNELRYCISKEIEVVEPYVEMEPVRHVKDSNELALGFSSSITDEDILPVPEGLILDLKSIYFDFSKSYIRTDQKSTMEENIALIKSNPDLIIKVIGHTDQVGSKEYNQKLSTKRAKAAVDYLISKGVSKDQIVAVLAVGEEEAGARYKNEDGSDDVEKMEESRRVDFYVIGMKK